MKLKLFIIIAVAMISTQSFSQKPFQPTVDQIVKLDAIPTDLMFDMLDIPDAKIQKPGSVKKFMASIQSFSSLNGKLNTGIGLSVSGQLFNNISLNEYLNDYWKRVWSNSQFSLGTAPTPNSDSSLNWGFGVRIQFINSGDGRLDPKNIEYLEKIALSNFEQLPFPDSTDGIAEFNKKMEKIVTQKNAELKVKEKAKELEEKAKDSVKTSNPNWNSSSLNLNAGIVFRSSQSKLLESGFNKYKVWVNGSYGLGSVCQFIGQIGFYTNKASISGGNDSSGGTGALMVRFGNPNFRIGVGTSVSDINSWNGVLSFAGEISLGLTSTWLVFSMDRNYKEGELPSIWIPNAGIKTSVGTSWIF